MDSSEKRKLTSLRNDELFNSCIKKLTVHEELSYDEKKFILECAIFLIREYENDVVVIGFSEHKEKIFIPSERFIDIGSKDDLNNMF